MLKEAADGFLADKAPIAHFRALRDSRDATGLSREVWADFGEMGFAGVLVAEDSAVLSARILSQGGSDAQKTWLGRIAAGQAIVALAIDEGVKHAPDALDARAERSGNGYRLSGTKAMVLDGHIADALIIAARIGDETALFLVEPGAKGLQTERTIMVDGHNASRLILEEVEVDADALIGSPGQGGALVASALMLGRGCAAASLVGAGDQAFQITLDYLKTRSQFGRLIG
ncbi:hypothetical protein LTR94_027338, partial [Friedmanniomyces endolithicus]